uniref:Putative kunitz n=1 Tax=Ixodes ricinus TaxID=34613 RepID=A0A6B0VCI1_IXORI
MPKILNNIFLIAALTALQSGASTGFHPMVSGYSHYEDQDPSLAHPPRQSTGTHNSEGLTDQKKKPENETTDATPGGVKPENTDPALQSEDPGAHDNMDYYDDDDDDEDSSANAPPRRPTGTNNSKEITNQKKKPKNETTQVAPDGPEGNDDGDDDYDDYDVSNVITLGTRAPTTSTTPKAGIKTPTAQPIEVALYVPDAPRIPKVCTEEQDEGKCDSNEEGTQEFRYYYNTAKNSCEIFPYKGCKGNGNNFKSEKECQNRCKVGAVYDSKEDARLPRVCKLRAAHGHCASGQEPELRYFYNQYTERCEMFTYSGCGGNENNFKTRHECERRCRYTPDGVCSLKPERGPCSVKIRRYYWDKELGDCKEFVYSGCAGNGNNFPDQETCRKYCKARSAYLELWWNVWSAMQSWVKRGDK